MLTWSFANRLGDWDRPPNFLLVDYYNDGNFAGSVFEVAAEMNNVTYNGDCCGTSSDAVRMNGTMTLSLTIAVLSTLLSYLV